MAFGGLNVQCRIGIDIGPVFAGVVGTLQPRYHLVGAPVHTAIALEQTCKVGTVHVSATAAEP
ncbi:guanylyl and adenylyl cyclase family member [Baffinella frigidus]|nr:guanylyl and adenylyl cyclase family member [Cryptophyta sp. CCMP2293]